MKRNDLIIKIFHILRLNVLDINLYIVAPIVLRVQIFDDSVILYVILNDVLLTDIQGAVHNKFPGL